ncbi:hypothetical protein [Maribacter sp. 2304DJ31-5]|uniref:hypothetical protein n=1 Tax=Maribacter sp. 2304DJ31-5 TaxID=3386273 RepID=UPI0039BD36B8
MVLVFFVRCGNTKGDRLPYQKKSFENGITIDYTLSEYDMDCGMYVDRNSKIKVNPERSALVIIDLWQNNFLDSITIKHINPLIKELNELGVKIIIAHLNCHRTRTYMT